MQRDFTNPQPELHEKTRETKLILSMLKLFIV